MSKKEKIIRIGLWVGLTALYFIFYGSVLDGIVYIFPTADTDAVDIAVIIFLPLFIFSTFNGPLKKTLRTRWKNERWMHSQNK